MMEIFRINIPLGRKTCVNGLFGVLLLSTVSTILVYIAKDGTILHNDISSQITDDYKETFLPRDINHNFGNKSIHKTTISILSAVGLSKSIHNLDASEIKLSGWVTQTFNVRFKCCILIKDGRIITDYDPKKMGGGTPRYAAKQFTCPVYAPLEDVAGITLQTAFKQCPKDENRYLTPYIQTPPAVNNSFGVCLKLVYGQNVDIVNLVTWLEYYNELGVDKVFMYTYNISETTNDVLNYYVKKGFVDRRPYNYPFHETHQVGEKRKIYYECEHVIVYDCFARLTGYTYTTIVDMDEFIVPRQHDNLKSMMNYLLEMNPDAAGFVMQPYLFLKDNTTKLPHQSDIETYFLRTRGLRGRGNSREKNIILPERIQFEGLTTHRFIPREGYRKINANPKVVTTNHYRKCYDDKIKFCSGHLIRDTYIIKILDRFRDKLTYIRLK